MTEPCQTTTSNQATVYYDGACGVCSREVALYRRLDRAAAIRWHDVSGDATFAASWERLPGLRWLAPIARWRPVRRLLERAYAWNAPRRMRHGAARFLVVDG